jgi:hypothetical protein
MTFKIYIRLPPHWKQRGKLKMNTRKLLMAISEAFIIYGLIIVGYGILSIHVTKTWFGDWHVDKLLDWLTLDVFMMVSFALSFFGFILWRCLKYTEKTT